MRLGDYVYFCPRTSDENADIITYGAPQKMIMRFNDLTIQPASGYMDTLQYGEKITKIWNGMANMRKYANKFHEGDLFYVDGAKPATDDSYINGDGANAIVTSVRPQNLMIRLSLEKRK